jgi:hypothetical protein
MISYFSSNNNPVNKFSIHILICVTISIFSLFVNFKAFSQSEQVNIYKDALVDTIISKHIEFNKIQNSIPGFRIQIHSFSGNSSRSNATSTQTKFMSTFRDSKAYVIFQTPYYVVRVGNFRTRLEAEAYRHRIMSEYPEAYIVKDYIELP